MSKCYFCGKVVEEQRCPISGRICKWLNNSLIHHHISYEPEKTVVVHKLCHDRFHNDVRYEDREETPEIIEFLNNNPDQGVSAVRDAFEIPYAVAYNWIRRLEELGLLENKNHIQPRGRQRGSTLSEETKKKISDSLRGIPKSEEHRRKNSEGHKGQISWNEGMKTGPLSEEHKQSISEGHKVRSLRKKRMFLKNIKDYY